MEQILELKKKYLANLFNNLVNEFLNNEKEINRVTKLLIYKKQCVIKNLYNQKMSYNTLKNIIDFEYVIPKNNILEGCILKFKYTENKSLIYYHKIYQQLSFIILDTR